MVRELFDGNELYESFQKVIKEREHEVTQLKREL